MASKKSSDDAMKLQKVVLDTNVHIDWMNKGRHEELMVGAGFVRYLSSVVQMELRAGARMLPARRALDHVVKAYRSAGRVVAPSPEVFDQAGHILRRLRDDGLEVRRASLVNDVLIALSARALGATVVTADHDYAAIRSVVEFKLQLIAR